jgi:uncharacterized protein (TIGR02246 family)
MYQLAVALVLSVIFAATSRAAPADEALKVLEAWTEAFSTSDVDRIVSLYAPDALFMATNSKSVVTETTDIRSYLERTLLTDRPRGAPTSDKFVKVLSEDVVLVTGLNTSTGVHDGKPYANPGRITFIIVKRGDAWKIVHMHRSAMPN